MLKIINIIHTFHIGHPHGKCPENRGLVACSRLTVASSIATAVISLKLLQNYEILAIIQRFIQSSFWLILRFLTIFMMIFSTQHSYFRDITPCSPLKSQLTRLATCFHAGIFFGLLDPEDGGDVTPKRRLPFNGLHGVISQKVSS
jgi:hypothetical protein